MSGNRNGGSSQDRPVRPMLVSSRSSRTPLTPRIAPAATPPSTPGITRKGTTVKSEPLSINSRLRGQEAGNQGKQGAANGNVTPRSPARVSRVDSRETTPQTEGSGKARPKSTLNSASYVGLGRPALSSSPALAGRPKSMTSVVVMKTGTPLVSKSPGLGISARSPQHNDLDSRFFHASEAAKQEPSPKKAEPKKAATFFYANGEQEDGKNTLSPEPSSPGLTTALNTPSTAQKATAVQGVFGTRSPPMLSPALSALSGNSPFFAINPVEKARNRSPSPGKDNVHLSYRKGASQIFGARPPSMPRADTEPPTEARRPSLASSSIHTSHHKSPSLSSLDSAGSNNSRRRSATMAETMQTPSPLAHGALPPASISPIVPKVPLNLPTIDTSLDLSLAATPSESCVSPTRHAADLATEARRERKVLDLEISNSSLLAINASLERELRKQKTELKRYRRLTRAGRFSVAPNDRSSRASDGLSTLGEEEGEDDSYFGRTSFSTQDDDFSDDDESITSSGEPLSPSTRHRDRLARDETKLQLDLAKHKELLVQSQMMNQSLKRCMFATEDMIKEGKKALQYHVRVSDVKLGGRILTGHEDSDEDREEIEVVDDDLPVGAGIADAKGFLDSWTGVAGSFDGSEGGDRDSGIEVDNPAHRQGNGVSSGLISRVLGDAKPSER